MSDRNSLIDSHNKNKLNINDNRSTFNTQNSILNSKKDSKSSKKKKILIISSITLIIVIAIIFGICFGIKSGEQPPQPPGPIPPTPSGFNIYEAIENETIVTFMPIDISSEIGTEYKDITSLEKYKNTISYTTELNMLLKNNKSVTFQKINRLHKLP